jgi:O-antigen/teichoic acid export membrane protein
MSFKNITIPILIKLSESILKFLFFLILPFFFNNYLVANLHIFLSCIFITSVFLRFANENIFLKKTSDLNLNKHQIKNHFLSILFFLIKSYALLILFFIMMFSLKKYLENLYFFNVFFNFYMEIFICSFCFSLISIISFGLRGLGNLNSSIFVNGYNWSLGLVAILIFFYINEINDIKKIIKFFTGYYLFYSLIVLFFFFDKLNFFKQKKKRVYNKLIFDRKNLYIQSVSGVFLNWVPIIIFSFFNNATEISYFSTMFRISLGLYVFLNIVDLISSEQISKYFQEQKVEKLIKCFNHFRLIKIFLAVLVILLLILLYLVFINQYENILDLSLFIFLVLIISNSLFGPIDLTYIMINKENELAELSILLIVFISFFFPLVSFLFDYKISLLIFGMIFFSFNALKYKNLRVRYLNKKNEKN